MRMNGLVEPWSHSALHIGFCLECNLGDVKRGCAQGINSDSVLCSGLESSALGYWYEDFGRASLIYLTIVSPAELPPRPLLERLAKELRRRLVTSLIFRLDTVVAHISIYYLYLLCVCYFFVGTPTVQLGYYPRSW